MAEAVRPTMLRILADAITTPEGTIRGVNAAGITEELNAEAFFDDISSFVNSEIDQLLFYRNLVHARDQWSAWAKRMSRGVLALLISQGLFTFYFATEKILARPVTSIVLLATFIISALVVGFCILCAGEMLHHHEQISEYRDKVL